MKRLLTLAAAVVAAMTGAGLSDASAGGVRHAGGQGPHGFSGGGFGHGSNPGWAAGGRSAGYRPLPPVSGTLRPGSHGLYGDRSFGPVGHGFGGSGRYHDATRGYASRGPGVYDLRGHNGRRSFGRRTIAGVGYGFGGGYGGTGYGYGGTGYGYGSDAPLTVRYGEPPIGDGYDAGPANYAGQGFVRAGGSDCGHCGPVTYQQSTIATNYGVGGGLGVYAAGAYGPGAQIIAIPDHYNVGSALHGCACGSSGLFGSDTF